MTQINFPKEYLDHGLLVWEYLQKIICGNWDNLKIPEWVKENHSTIISSIHDLNILKEYVINHDCGKHLVKIIDSDGKPHYPNHAEASYKYYLEFFPENTTVANLILNDMFFHQCSAEDLKFSKLSIKDLFSLLIASLAEIHANSQLFGGIDSTSFKIKYKQIDRRGKLLCKQEKSHGYCYVFLRGNLSNAQKSVQAGHSLIEICQKYSFKNHPSLIYLIVKSEEKLKRVAQELIDNNINFSLFREPDMNNEITSIATEPIFSEKRKVLERYQLYHG